MAIQMNRPGSEQYTPAAPIQLSLTEVKPYDIIADQQETQRQLAHSQEIEELTASIDVNDFSTIVTFGAHSAEEISKASDTILRSMNLEQLDKSGTMLTTLGKIMDRFDPKELQDNPGLFGKLFGNVRSQLEKILAKYHTLGDDVDKIYIELKQYEAEITQSNRRLEEMFQANVGYFHELEKYIVAGNQGCQEIADYIGQLQNEMQQTGNEALSFEIQSLQQAQMLLEQRTQDLRTAETVALQSIPMIKTIEFSNVNLIRKINSAFIVTLPVFKQALAQAIMLKRQRLQADAITALDERTNQMLITNAKNTSEQAKLTARLAAGSSIKADTLETTWHTILNGLEETKKIQESAKSQRTQDQVKLEAIKKDFLNHFPASGR